MPLVGVPDRGDLCRKYFAEASSIGFRKSLKYGFGTLGGASTAFSAAWAGAHRPYLDRDAGPASTLSVDSIRERISETTSTCEPGRTRRRVQLRISAIWRATHVAGAQQTQPRRARKRQARSLFKIFRDGGMPDVAPGNRPENRRRSSPRGGLGCRRPSTFAQPGGPTGAVGSVNHVRYFRRVTGVDSREFSE